MKEPDADSGTEDETEGEPDDKVDQADPVEPPKAYTASSRQSVKRTATPAGRKATPVRKDTPAGSSHPGPSKAVAEEPVAAAVSTIAKRKRATRMAVDSSAEEEEVPAKGKRGRRNAPAAIPPQLRRSERVASRAGPTKRCA